ncbi:hypothetical protein TUBRATIS_26770 [Tubulinosema ratisbonensis]|uniref:Uncharacterized protein n=1 Tax=Tubulinosema ratisbonensis TaxID=291195 RepID=A0A437AIB7_9MICR|nr:hypothetical protein TUBRATIS_26770 [Tubulinosema ratisbonensis]
MQVFLLIKLAFLSTLELKNLIKFIREETETLNKSSYVPLSFNEWTLKRGEVELASNPELKSADKKLSCVRSELKKLSEDTKPQMLTYGYGVLEEKFKKFEAYQEQLKEVLLEKVKQEEFYKTFQFKGQIKKLLEKADDSLKKLAKTKMCMQKSEDLKKAFNELLTETVKDLNEAGKNLDLILKEKQVGLLDGLKKWASGPVTKFNYKEDQELLYIIKTKKEIENTVNDSEAFISLVVDKKMTLEDLKSLNLHSKLLDESHKTIVQYLIQLESYAPKTIPAAFKDSIDYQKFEEYRSLDACSARILALKRTCAGLLENFEHNIPDFLTDLSAKREELQKLVFLLKFMFALTFLQQDVDDLEFLVMSHKRNYENRLPCGFAALSDDDSVEFYFRLAENVKNNDFQSIEEFEEIEEIRRLYKLLRYTKRIPEPLDKFYQRELSQFFSLFNVTGEIYELKKDSELRFFVKFLFRERRKVFGDYLMKYYLSEFFTVIVILIIIIFLTMKLFV